MTAPSIAPTDLLEKQKERENHKILKVGDTVIMDKDGIAFLEKEYDPNQPPMIKGDFDHFFLKKGEVVEVLTYKERPCAKVLFYDVGRRKSLFPHIVPIEYLTKEDVAVSEGTSIGEPKGISSEGEVDDIAA